MRNGLAIRHAIERHRQVERICLHAQIGARECHALGIARQLKVRRRRLQRLEANITIAENEHATVGDTAVHASGHLQNFVRAQMHAREHIPSPVDHVGESRVVDDHRIESRDIQRALTSRRHGQKKRFRYHTLEKRTDHANRLAAVIVRGRDARIARAHPLGRFFNRRARGQENRHSAFRARHLLQELLVEKIEGLLALDFNLRGFRRIEGGNLQDVGALEIARIKRGIDRR